jgi:hypothetical protein
MEMRINISNYFSSVVACLVDLSVCSSLFSSFLSSSLLSFLSSLSSLEPSLTQLLYKTVLPVAIVTTFEAVSNTF